LRSIETPRKTGGEMCVDHICKIVYKNEVDILKLVFQRYLTLTVGLSTIKITPSARKP